MFIRIKNTVISKQTSNQTITVMMLNYCCRSLGTQSVLRQAKKSVLWRWLIWWTIDVILASAA